MTHAAAPTSTPLRDVLGPMIQGVSKGKVFTYEELPELTANELSAFLILTQCNADLWPKAPFPDLDSRDDATRIADDEVCAAQLASSGMATYIEDKYTVDEKPYPVPMVRTTWRMIELTHRNVDGYSASVEGDGRDEDRSLQLVLHPHRAWLEVVGIFYFCERVKGRLDVLGSFEYPNGLKIAFDETDGVSLCDLFCNFPLQHPVMNIYSARTAMTVAMQSLLVEDFLGKIIEGEYRDILQESEEFDRCRGLRCA